MLRMLGKSAAIGAAALLAVCVNTGAAGAQALTNPFLVTSGNPNCATLNGSTDLLLAGVTSNFGFKIEAPLESANFNYSGTYTLQANSSMLPVREMTGLAPADNVNTVTVAVNGTNQMFDWAGTLGIDAVIVKASTGSWVYVYPEGTSGASLHGPTNASGGFAAISHIEFCYDYEVTVAKTASTTFTRTYTWTIDKSVSPATLDLFAGDSGSVDYEIAVQKIATDSAWAVSGSVTIQNKTPLTATITAITDAMGSISVPLTGCSAGQLAPWATLTCSYQATLDDGTSRTNQATVTTSGSVGGGQAQAPVDFITPTTLVGPTSVNVDDSDGQSWGFADSGSRRYSRTLSCNSGVTDDSRLVNNTATIDETGASDSAGVRVNCYRLGVTKTADTSFQRKYSWTIVKTATGAPASLAVGESATANYAINLTAAPQDIDHKVSGSVVISNPAPIPAPISGIADVMTNFGAVTLACPATFSNSIAAQSSVTCTYSVDLANGTQRTNTVTVTLQNNTGGSTTFNGTATVAFSATPTAEIDRCVSVADAFNGGAALPVGQACYGGTTSFTAPQTIPGFASCGTKSISNTASFLAENTGATGSSTATIGVNVPCTPIYAGCTRTIGYWKTHESAVYQRLNPNGINVPVLLGSGGGKTLTVSTVSGALNVFYAGDSSNGVNKLRAQLLAAKLNVLAGADTVTVAAAIGTADTLLYSIAPADWKTLSAAQKQQIDALKTLLDNYNNGLNGPSHCQ